VCWEAGVREEGDGEQNRTAEERLRRWKKKSRVEREKKEEQREFRTRKKRDFSLVHLASI